MSKRKSDSNHRSAEIIKSSVTQSLMALKPQIISDGAAARIALGDAAKALIPTVSAPIEVHAAALVQGSGQTEVVFIDTSVPDWQAVLAGVEKTDPGVAVDLIDGGQPGVAQIAIWAETHSGYDAIHVLSQDNQGGLIVGTDIGSKVVAGDAQDKHFDRPPGAPVMGVGLVSCR